MKKKITSETRIKISAINIFDEFEEKKNFFPCFDSESTDEFKKKCFSVLFCDDRKIRYRTTCKRSFGRLSRPTNIKCIMPIKSLLSSYPQIKGYDSG